MKLLYTAAHGGFASENVPLGGGGAVCDQLMREWSRVRPFDSIELVTPAVLGSGAPTGKDLTRYSERQYASFCRDFERACTALALTRDPRDTAVLANDVSEGPDFAALAARGFRIFTIFHVDVVAYVADIYLRGWISPRALTAAYEYLHWAVPDLGKLVFQKQKDSVRYSERCFAPSQRVAEILRGCYAGAPVEVTPWGTWAPEVDESTIAMTAELRKQYCVDGPVILTLSRISPEKGQDRLLRVLRDYPDPLHVFLCGGAAYMQGRRHLEKLRELAGRLPPRVKVHFPGHVTGVRKQAYFQLADLYVFPSVHESYGLTLMEALHAGLPAVCLDHQGAREIMRGEFGRVVREERLAATIREMLADPAGLRSMSQAAKVYAREHPFSKAAARIAEAIQGASSSSKPLG